MDTPLAEARAHGLDPRVLGLIIFPTEQCNLRCVYCYENFPNSRLNPNIICGIERLIESRAVDMRELSIGWFGGEPLLEAETVLRINSYALALSSSHSFKFSSHITTNAVLLKPRLLKELVGVNVTVFQISLDGEREYHDKTRIQINNLGTFDRIIENLYSALELPEKFSILLRLHVTSKNANSISDLIDILSVDILNDSRFKVFLKPIFNYGWMKNNDIILRDSQTLTMLHNKLKRFPSSSTLGSKTYKCCYAGMPNQFVIRANGKIQKCTVALYDDRNDIGELTSDGTFHWYSQEKLQAWSEGLLLGDEAKMACPLQHISKRSKNSIQEQ